MKLRPIIVGEQPHWLDGLITRIAIGFAGLCLVALVSYMVWRQIA